MEIREFKARDIKTLVRIIQTIPQDARQKLADIMRVRPEDGEEATEGRVLEIGLSIFEVLASVTDDIYAWLADMAGKTATELDEMPAAELFDIVSEVVGKAGFRSFFDSAGHVREEPSNTTT